MSERGDIVVDLLQHVLTQIDGSERCHVAEYEREFGKVVVPQKGCVQGHQPRQCLREILQKVTANVQESQALHGSNTDRELSDCVLICPQRLEAFAVRERVGQLLKPILRAVKLQQTTGSREPYLDEPVIPQEK